MRRHLCQYYLCIPYFPEYKSHRAISHTPKIGSGFSISLFIRQGESRWKMFCEAIKNACARAASVIAPAGRTLENGWSRSVIMRMSSNLLWRAL